MVLQQSVMRKKNKIYLYETLTSLLLLNQRTYLLNPTRQRDGSMFSLGILQILTPAAWSESGNTVVVKVEVRVKQHLCGPFFMRQRADLSWRRRGSCSREVSCQLKVDVHPSVGRHPCLIDKTFGQGQREWVNVRVVELLLVVLRGQ